MNVSITLPDTHKAVRELQESGIEAKTAEAIVKTVQSASLSSTPATQADMARLEGTLQAVAGSLRAELYRALLIHGFVTVSAIIGAAMVLGNSV